jgi:hypothetical protein
VGIVASVATFPPMGAQAHSLESGTIAVHVTEYGADATVTIALATLEEATDEMGAKDVADYVTDHLTVTGADGDTWTETLDDVTTENVDGRDPHRRRRGVSTAGVVTADDTVLSVGGGVVRTVVAVAGAFTVGHSLTLGASALGWVAVPSRPVEALVALSVAAAALHAVRGLVPNGERLAGAGIALAAATGWLLDRSGLLSNPLAGAHPWAAVLGPAAAAIGTWMCHLTLAARPRPAAGTPQRPAIRSDNRARSLAMALLIALAMTGVASVANPVGAPWFRNLISVPPAAGSQV